MKIKFFLAFVLCFSIIVNAHSQKKQEIKNGNPFSFQESYHSLGFAVFTGVNFAPKLKNHQGDIKPVLFHSIVPEFILQYNYMIKNGFGISLEVPFGMFTRSSITQLSEYGASNDVWLEMGSFYVGFTAKLSVMKELSKNVCMQGELGIKFNPFCYPASQWYHVDYHNVIEFYYFEDNSSINFPTVRQKFYAVPDATATLLFFFHSKKKPKNNLLVGLNVNLSFVKRIEVIYDTRFSELSLINSPHFGVGDYGWNSSAIGITIGYRFFGVK